MNSKLTAEQLGYFTNHFIYFEVKDFSYNPVDNQFDFVRTWKASVKGIDQFLLDNCLGYVNYNGETNILTYGVYDNSYSAFMERLKKTRTANYEHE